MRKVTTLFCTLVLLTCVFSFSSFAQGQQEEINKRKNNWFISLGGSANLLQAEQDKLFSLEDRLSFGGAFAVGKWFNPYFGARIQVMGGELKGFNVKYDYNGKYTRPNDAPRLSYPMGLTGVYPNLNWNDLKTVKSKNGVDGFAQQFNYGSAGIDMMANLTNLFRGSYKEVNKFDVVPYMGLGYITAFNNDETTIDYHGIFARIGVNLAYNINSKWAIFLEPQANATTKEFDGYVGDADADLVANIVLGIQYTINRDYSVPNLNVLSQDEVDFLNRKINENRSLIENHQNILERQQKLLRDLGDCCDEKGETIIVNNNNFLPEYIRFSLNSAEITGSERTKIGEAIQFLNANPNSKLLLIGYADKKTGNRTINLALSQKRVESVANELKRGGINSNRIVLEWKGDSEQPYQQNEWNRVVIMVERK